MEREKGRELELKVLGTNVENCFCMQLGNKKSILPYKKRKKMGIKERRV